MKQVIFFAVLVVLTLSITQKSQTAEQKQWQDFKKKSTWAKVALEMAELKSLTGGAIDDLAQGIQDVIDSLVAKNASLTEEFNERTVQHGSEVQRLGDEIDQANYDISYNQEFLDNVLYVQRQNLIDNIAKLDQEIEELGQHMEDEKKRRQLQKQDYLVRVAEHQDAINAIEECMGLLNQLVEDGTLSLAQITSAKYQFDRLKVKLGSNADSVLVEALISLASQEFADTEKTGQVIELLNQVKTNLIGSLAKSQQDEEKAEQDFQQDMITSQAAIDQAIIERSSDSAELVRCEESITFYEAFVAERQTDLAQFEQQLNTENLNYEQAVANYESLIQQIGEEKAACELALDLVKNAGIADYIGNRTDQETVVDRPHGDVQYQE